MQQSTEAGYPYLALKAAHKLYGKSPRDLPPEERAHVQDMAQKQGVMEAHVLASTEARNVMVPPATLQAAMREIRRRYADTAEFLADLARNGLDETRFSAALERELKVEAILEKVGTRAEKVSNTDIELYYRYHLDQFHKPETRLARHILVTINEEIAENTREEARKRTEAIAAQLRQEPGLFEDLALKHSECPTALEGGKLGDLPEGKLFPALDKVLFGLKAGEISRIVESELGFHILRCDAIAAGGEIDLAQASLHIRKVLEHKRKRAYQQAWMKELLQTAARAG